MSSRRTRNGIADGLQDAERRLTDRYCRQIEVLYLYLLLLVL